MGTLRPKREEPPVTVVDRRLALGLALFFAAAALVRDTVLLKAFAFYVVFDSLGYLIGDPLRSRPYPILAWLTDAADHPLNLVYLQIGLGALAIGLLVYVVARRNPSLAILIGLLFSLDTVWSLSNRTLLADGPFTSFAVISLAILVHQYETRERASRRALVASGALFAWTCTIRPSNLYLLALIALAYLIFTRSGRKVAWLAGGMAILLLATSSLTWYQTGHFRVSGGTGYYVAFPLFSYQLFDASNGPQSLRIDRTLRSCDPSVDYTRVNIFTSNQYLWGDFFPCLQNNGWSFDEIDSGFTQAYLEGIRTRPGTFLYDWLGWTSIGLGYTTGTTLDSGPSSCDAKSFKFCDQLLAEYRQAPPGMQSAAGSWEQAADRPIAILSQVYLIPFDATLPAATTDSYTVMGLHSLSIGYVAAVTLIWLAMLVLLWLRTRGSARVLGLAAACTVIYVCFTVPGGHVFLPRYISVLGPIYAVLSALIVLILLRIAANLAVWVGPRRALALAAASAALGVSLFLLAPRSLIEHAIPEPTQHLAITGPFVHDPGYAFEASLPDLAPYSDSATSQQSNMSLYEDGHQLGPAHSGQSDIRDLGRGRFSHLGALVIFSTSDNSDPNTNGRRYTVDYIPPLSWRRRLLACGLAAALPGVLAMVGMGSRKKRGLALAERARWRAPWPWSRTLNESGV
jgi:hypothetical protein